MLLCSINQTSRRETEKTCFLSEACVAVERPTGTRLSTEAAIKICKVMTTKDNLLQPTVLATAPSRKTLCGVSASSSRPAKPLVPSWLKNLMCLYGIILGETPSPRYALRILHAQAALLMFLFPFTLGFAVRILLLLWFVVALLQCRGDK